MDTISFMGANYVARELGYRMTGDWGQGEAAASAFFRPPETFAERFEALLAKVGDMGFTAFDIWTGHLGWQWATQTQLETARTLLQRYKLTAVSYAGGYGSTAVEFEAACRLAATLGIPVLGGGSPYVASDRPGAIKLLERYGVRFAVENHPGLLTPEEILAFVGDGAGGLIGTTVDTGWFGTAGVDADRAIKLLGRHILHVHLKDVLEGGHTTCQFGQGCVPLQACVQALRDSGYRGALSVEHEPYDHDPSDECRASAATLREWLQAS
jgi:sugar phosphate isomerase/epimerase